MDEMAELRVQTFLNRLHDYVQRAERAPFADYSTEHQALIRSMLDLSSEDTQSLLRFPALLDATTVLDERLFGVGGWLSRVSWCENDGLEPTAGSYWDPSGTMVEVADLVEVHRALRPGWKAKGEQ